MVTLVSYYVHVSGLYGDCRLFSTCKNWINEKLDNKQNAISYANKHKKLLNSLQMK
jgi:hypothetical protein